MAVIALDLGGTKLSAAIFQPSGEFSYRRQVPLDGRTGHEVGKLITDTLCTMQTEARRENINLSAVGICVPGISHIQTGTVWAPNIPGWDDYPLLAEIKEALADDSISVAVDNDRACSVLGESWKGAAQGHEHVIFLAVGTGIGAGIISDNQVLRGADDIAGAVGWLGLSQPYSGKYDACGHFEYYASGEGLVRAAKELAGEDRSYQGPLSVENITTKLIFEMFGSGDVIAQKVIQQAITLWGMATANFISIFNSRIIIFGGGVFGPALEFLPQIKAEAEKWAQPLSVKKVILAGSALGSNAGLYGAAFRALSFPPGNQ